MKISGRTDFSCQAKCSFVAIDKNTSGLLAQLKKRDQRWRKYESVFLMKLPADQYYCYVFVCLKSQRWLNRSHIRQNSWHSIGINAGFKEKIYEQAIQIYLCQCLLPLILLTWFDVVGDACWQWRQSLCTKKTASKNRLKACFPLDNFVRANRQKSRNSSYLFAVNFFAIQFSPVTVLNSCSRFTSREQSRQVENRLKTELHLIIKLEQPMRAHSDIGSMIARQKASATRSPGPIAHS